MGKLIEEFYLCPDCGFKMSVWRIPGRQRERFHKKWLFCVNCNEDKNFIKAD